jgi:hypothetical protein
MYLISSFINICVARNYYCHAQTSDTYIISTIFQRKECLPSNTAMLSRWVPDLLPGYTVILLRRAPDLLTGHAVTLLRG